MRYWVGAKPAQRSPSPSVTAEAPGRVNLIGEHLDYLGGSCLPIALELRTRASVNMRDDNQVVVNSAKGSWSATVDDLHPGRVAGWPAYVAGTLWALGIDRGVEIDITSTIPIAAGLSSSAALECSVALAVNDLFELDCTRDELARACHRAENDMVGAPTGPLDQLVAMFAQSSHALLADFSHPTPVLQQIAFRPHEQGVALLIIDTRVRHDMSIGGYGGRRRDCEHAAAALGAEHLGSATADAAAAVQSLSAPLDRRARYVFSEMDRVRRFVAGLRSGDWETLGPILTEGHNAARDDFEISCAELDTAVAAACDAGALGARMTGGGFGGCAIALVHEEQIGHVEAAVRSAFLDHGWPRPQLLRGVAGPAGSVRR